MFRVTISILGIVLTLACVSAGAHGGGLNKDGCHNDRKIGGYHCHRQPSVVGATPQPVGTRSTAANTKAATMAQIPRAATPTCYTGPRGGTYTIAKSGKTNYGGC